jgi:cell division protein FtsB
MTTKQTLSSKIAVAGLLILALFLADWKYRQWASENSVLKQKRDLEQQANSLEQKNDELSQSLQYLNSDSFKESVAREQLNLKKPGEQVYTFVDAPQTGQVLGATTEQPSNPKKWLDYFFRKLI